MKKILYSLAILIVLIAIGQSFNLFPKIALEKYINIPRPSYNINQEVPKLQNNESVTENVIENSIPSVVTIGIDKITTTGTRIQIDPSNPSNPFQTIPSQQKKVHQNIGSGFIVSTDGLIITNKHVVSDTEATYTVLTYDKQQYEVINIFRDPLNDLSILKIKAKNLQPLTLGDSSTIKLGQLAIAIGTPLGEFTNTVTAGIISGLGRGITAGSPFEGYVEKLDNVIQTDAAISPGNSGGPLLNSSGQVIGINTAVAQQGQNIGFAIPSNVVSDLLNDFQKRGGIFERPFLGVRYSIIDKTIAQSEKLVEGAYVVFVIKDSPAYEAGIKPEDIITAIDNQKINNQNENSVAKILLDKKIGQQVSLKVYRNGKTTIIKATLKGAS
ncbi:MAG: trypsin-like peptidase domain-containing protein [bacterium]